METNSQVHPSAALEPEKSHLSIEKEAGWTPDPACMFWRRAKPRAIAGVAYSIQRLRHGLDDPEFRTK